MNRIGRGLGWFLAGLGLLIILSMVMPKNFWWFLLGALLICGGVRLLCRR